MIEFRYSGDRGYANYGWLKSRHSFSFANYYDPKHMGFSKLRVINDDIVQPGAGFSAHGHRDMEIISYVVHGEIEHKDSQGHIERLPAGEFQLMSAGTGILHSEYNASSSEQLRFLQIWIEPERLGEDPSYQQKPVSQQSGVTIIASPDGEDNSMVIKQDVRLQQVILLPKQSLTLPLARTRKYYIHQVQGETHIDGQHLAEGDAAKVSEQQQVVLKNNLSTSSFALFFDLP